MACFRFVDALSFCTDYTAGAKTEVCLLPGECSHYQIVHHVLTLWFALHPLLGEYSTTSLWYIIDWRGRDCAVTFPLSLMTSYHNCWVWTVHIHTHYSLCLKGKKKSRTTTPSLGFLLVVQMKPKLVFTAPAEYTLIISFAWFQASETMLVTTFKLR